MYTKYIIRYPSTLLRYSRSINCIRLPIERFWSGKNFVTVLVLCLDKKLLNLKVVKFYMHISPVFSCSVTYSYVYAVCNSWVNTHCVVVPHVKEYLTKNLSLIITLQLLQMYCVCMVQNAHMVQNITNTFICIITLVNFDMICYRVHYIQTVTPVDCVLIILVSFVYIRTM